MDALALKARIWSLHSEANTEGQNKSEQIKLDLLQKLEAHPAADIGRVRVVIPTSSPPQPAELALGDQDFHPESVSMLEVTDQNQTWSSGRWWGTCPIAWWLVQVVAEVERNGLIETFCRLTQKDLVIGWI